MHKNCDLGTTAVFSFVYLFDAYPKLVTKNDSEHVLILAPLTPSENRIAEEKSGYDQHQAKNRSH